MKTYLVAAALSLLASSAFAAPPDAAPAPSETGAKTHRHFSSDDMAALADARIAGLKAGLKLTPDQEKTWPALETALRDVGKARAAQFAQHMEKMKSGEPDAMDALRDRVAMMTSRAAELSKIADAAKPLYDSLDESQKRRFGVLLRQAGSMHVGMHMGWRHRRFGDDG